VKKKVKYHNEIWDILRSKGYSCSFGVFSLRPTKDQRIVGTKMPFFTVEQIYEISQEIVECERIGPEKIPGKTTFTNDWYVCCFKTKLYYVPVEFFADLKNKLDELI
jgi:hypothetical protein